VEALNTRRQRTAHKSLRLHSTVNLAATVSFSALFSPTEIQIHNILQSTIGQDRRFIAIRPDRPITSNQGAIRRLCQYQGSIKNNMLINQTIMSIRV